MTNRGRHKKIKIVDIAIQNTPLKYIKYIWYKDKNNNIKLKIYSYLK